MNTMKEGDLCYIPQGVMLYSLNMEGKTVDYLQTDKPITALILDNHPWAQKFRILANGKRWSVLKRDTYHIEV
tara:strand:- start:173 stop:391 length:219 start_codon:yes stop_codon:yes gene_type:complete